MYWKATNKENELFLSSRHWWMLHDFPIIDCRASVFDILGCKLNSSRWIGKLRIYRMNGSFQANADDSYTTSQLLIAVHLFLIFQKVGGTRVDGFQSYEYGE